MPVTTGMTTIRCAVDEPELEPVLIELSSTVSLPESPLPDADDDDFKSVVLRLPLLDRKCVGEEPSLAMLPELSCMLLTLDEQPCRISWSNR